jgi:hypothetical protein
MIDDQNGGDANEFPVDLSPIDPLRDQATFDTIAKAIVRDGMAARARRDRSQSRYAVVAHVSGWSVPILAAAALIIAAAAPLLTRSMADLSPASTDVATATERLGIPSSIAALAQSQQVPTPAEVIAAFDAHWRGGGQ